VIVLVEFFHALGELAVAVLEQLASSISAARRRGTVLSGLSSSA
jgi:hypothetical protein